MSDAVVLAEVDKALVDLMRPAHDLDARLAAQEELLTTELAELRERRRRLKAVLRSADPATILPGMKTGQKKAKAASTPDKMGISETLITETEAWLREHAEEINGNGGFTATSLVREHGFTLAAQSSTSKALTILRDRDVITLDHVGQGGARNFKVVV